MKKFRSIREKFLILFLTAIIIISVIPTVISYQLSKSNLEDLINDKGQTDSEAYANVMGSWFSERENEMVIYSHSMAISSMDWEKARRYLNHQLEMEKNVYSYFFIADKRGEYNATTLLSDENLKDKLYFQKAMVGDKFISDPVPMKEISKAVSIVTVPIKNSQGNIIGVLGGAINVEKIYNHIKDFKVNHKESYSFLLSGEGLIFVHPDSDMCMRENLTVPSDVISEDIAELAKNNLSRDRGFFQINFKGDNSTYYFNEIPNTNNWRIVTKIPDEYLYTPITEVNEYLVLIALLAILLAYVFGNLFVRTISKPIIKLRDIFGQAAKGDMTVRSDVLTNDEIGEASKSFNKMMDTITHLTYYDHLTGLPNRKVFMERLNMSLAHCKKNEESLSLVVIGMDKFKRINDSFGHDLGDKLLKKIANDLVSYLGEEVVICRLGGDEFGILITEFQREKSILKEVERVLNQVSSTMMIEKHELFVTFSIGISFYPKDGSSGYTLFKNANIAMHRAKEKGGNNYQLYTPSMKETLLEEISLDTNMRHALKNQEFLLHYQPIINAEEKVIEGVEALVRWKHPNLGMISPAKFVPLAEENELIIPLGEWILRTACRQVKEFQRVCGIPLYASVNISAIQFKQKGFINMVAKVLEETGLAPEYLKLEITESIVVTNTEYTIKILEELQRLGISISIDDFGTGYSSLRYLKEFALDNLKIDQSFVRDITENPKNAAIVSTVMDIAKNLNLNVIAEGVETRDDLEYLKSLNCYHMQGYYFSKPLESEEFVGLFNGVDEVAITLE